MLSNNVPVNQLLGKASAPIHSTSVDTCKAEGEGHAQAHCKSRRDGKLLLVRWVDVITSHLDLMCKGEGDKAPNREDKHC